MFLSRASVVLLVAFLGTSWSNGDGVASASPLPQGFMGGPGYYPQYPGLPYYSPQPRVVYVQALRSSPPLIRTWDGIHDWAQNTVQSVLGQPAPNTDRNQNTGQPAYNSY
ncbi:unnamed protein product [Spodoptera exigua]|nr:unnamed protein product [Spodoptera exigua]